MIRDIRNLLQKIQNSREHFVRIGGNNSKFTFLFANIRPNKIKRRLSLSVNASVNVRYQIC